MTLQPTLVFSSDWRGLLEWWSSGGNFTGHKGTLSICLPKDEFQGVLGNVFFLKRGNRPNKIGNHWYGKPSKHNIANHHTKAKYSLSGENTKVCLFTSETCEFATEETSHRIPSHYILFFLYHICTNLEKERCIACRHRGVEMWVRQTPCTVFMMEKGEQICLWGKDLEVGKRRKDNMVQ